MKTIEQIVEFLNKANIKTSKIDIWYGIAYEAIIKDGKDKIKVVISTPDCDWSNEGDVFIDINAIRAHRADKQNERWREVANYQAIKITRSMKYDLSDIATNIKKYVDQRAKFYNAINAIEYCELDAFLNDNKKNYMVLYTIVNGKRVYMTKDDLERKCGWTTNIKNACIFTKIDMAEKVATRVEKINSKNGNVVQIHIGLYQDENNK